MDKGEEGCPGPTRGSCQHRCSQDIDLETYAVPKLITLLQITIKLQLNTIQPITIIKYHPNYNYNYFLIRTHNINKHYSLQVLVYLLFEILIHIKKNTCRQNI